MESFTHPTVIVQAFSVVRDNHQTLVLAGPSHAARIPNAERCGQLIIGEDHPRRNIIDIDVGNFGFSNDLKPKCLKETVRFSSTREVTSRVALTSCEL
jgi:hypothetical protein